MANHGKNWRTFPGDIPGWQLRLHDPFAHALTVINETHRLSHDGMVFSYTHKFLTVVNGATARMILAPGAAQHPHINQMRITVGAGDIDIVAYENPTVTSYGTTVPNGGKPNVNRSSTNLAELAIYENVTVSAQGSSLHRTWIPPTGTGQGNTFGVLNVTAGEEWILKPGDEYLIEVTNNSGATIDMALDMLWYEVNYQDV